MGEEKPRLSVFRKVIIASVRATACLLSRLFLAGTETTRARTTSWRTSANRPGIFRHTKVDSGGWGVGAAQHRGSILASHQAALGLIPSIPQKKFREKIIHVGEVNQWRGQRKVDSDLKMFTKPIYFWPLATQCYKNGCFRCKHNIRWQHFSLSQVELTNQFFFSPIKMQSDKSATNTATLKLMKTHSITYLTKLVHKNNLINYLR